MRFERAAALACGLVMLGAMATGASAQGQTRGAWVELGCQKVSFDVDRDVLRVGRREGRFNAIRLHARAGDVEMLDVKVIYGNGDPADIQVRRILRRGERTRALELRGVDRLIDQVEMVYRAVPNFRGREAVVCVEGLAATPAPGPSAGNWVELGCQTVSFNVDRDVLRVGRREGRFNAIRLNARAGDVEMLNVKVVYGNGDPDDIQVRRILRRGERTRALNLRGADRLIDQVEMVYRAVPNFKGREAVVCVEAL